MSVDQAHAVAQTTDVHAATQAFAAALRETTVFQRFEQTANDLRDDVVARCAIDAYQQRAQSLRALQTLGAVSAVECQLDLPPVLPHKRILLWRTRCLTKKRTILTKDRTRCCAAWPGA
ncbi:hypothetical protein [Candidatus Chloroploca asiatica]|uniref:Uncharacterized protein n=1 Tax=Candidatus Chloroploca asiatica TaxID=1506545 RepID=A0A2H3KPR5_9CHLR|nr:hypothetical protein [Candidatus Chloroploca asiatica]PDW00261.1 hypothetical protein A9Q02_10610 [Candidatus Chloroploca asiatica]